MAEISVRMSRCLLIDFEAESVVYSSETMTKRHKLILKFARQCFGEKHSKLAVIIAWRRFVSGQPLNPLIL